MKRWRPKHPGRVAARRARAQRRVGEGARCHCGESRPEALIAGSKPMRCAECQRKAEGRPVTDDHHDAGRGNSPLTIPVPVNDHRAELSVMQMDWGKTMRENPEGDPLIAAAALLRGSADITAYLQEHRIDVAIALLEMVAESNRQRLGSKWWRGTDVERFAPKK